jgi:hypothetical protein
MSNSLIYLSSGGVVTPEGDVLSGFTVVSGATLVVLSGGFAAASVVATGAGLTLSGGIAAGSLISSGAVESVTAGGTETSAAVLSGGLLAIASGGTALEAGLLSGGSVSSGVGAVLTYTTDLPGTARVALTADGSGYGVSLASGTVQTYTVASTGWVTITAEGAAGGGNYVAQGGAGAAVTASFDLNAATVLEIIVGGSGEGAGISAVEAGNDGGGGGSFVYDETDGILLEAAGGGGGAGDLSNGGNATVTTTGGSGFASGGVGGVGGDGGAGGGTSGGGGGAGFLTAGGSGLSGGPGGDAAGSDFTGVADGGVNSGAGNNYSSYYDYGYGGYGGGGAAGSGGGGGGGGGYSGGGGGGAGSETPIFEPGEFSGYATGQGGGGGGSYVDTNDLPVSGVALSAGAVPMGNGEVLISAPAPLIGATQTDLVLNSGGLLIDEGTVFNGSLSSAALTVSAGNSAFADVYSGGTLTVLSGGSASFGAFGGTTIIDGGAVIGDNPAIYGGSVILSSGASLFGNDLGGGDLIVASGGSVSRISVSSGALLALEGSGTFTSVIAGGTELVTGSGAETSGTAVEGGLIIVASGGVASGEVLGGSTPTYLPAYASAGDLSVGAGGSAVGLTIGSGATAAVASGGAVDGVTILGGGNLVLAAGARGAGIDFAGAGGTLVIGGASLAGVSVSGLSYDNIVLADIPYSSGASISAINSGYEIEDGGSTYLLSATPAVSTASIALADDGGVVEVIPCFAAGTRIATPAGEVAVERIAAGDWVTTVGPSGAAARPVVWAGRRAVSLVGAADPGEVVPIRIRAGAIAPGVPRRDVRLSPHHAVRLGELLFEAGSLVNGGTILHDMETTCVTYHHIELDEHDMLLAEGLPAESFLDRGHRALLGAIGPGQVDRAGPPAGFCLPIVRAGAPLTAARGALLARAVELGFAVTEAIDMEVRACGRRLRPTPANGSSLYPLPPGATELEILSPAGPVWACQAERGARPDERLLGLALAGVRLLTNSGAVAVALADTSHTGLYPADGPIRWTNGHARVQLPACTGSALVDIAVVNAVSRLAMASDAPAIGRGATARSIAGAPA